MATQPLVVAVHSSVLMQLPVRERLESAGFEPKTGSPSEVKALMREGQARYGKLIAEIGFKPE